MKPFLKLPKVICNKDGQEKQVDTRVQPDQIADYYPGVFTGTVIVLNSGSSFFCPLPIEQVDAVLETYANTVKHRPNQFGVLEMTDKKQ